MSTKQKLLDLLDFTHQQEQAFIDGLTDAERSFEGTFKQWSAKDLLAHSYAWKAHYAKQVDVLKAGGTPQTVDDVDAANATTYEAHHGKSWEEALSEWAQANAALVAHVESLDEDQLTNPEAFPGQNGQPLWRGFAGNSVIHTALHLGEFYARRGDLERANALHLTMVEMLLALDSSENWRAITLYNLACHYALTGQAEKAIPNLREALALNEGMTEWSKQDPDLKSLHELEVYQALYEA
jgi:tetratricopeptide (TPR) repeat protein